MNATSIFQQLIDAVELLRKKYRTILSLLLCFLLIAVFSYYSIYKDTALEVTAIPVLGWEMNKSRKVSDYIFPDVITTITPSKNICSNNNPPRVMIIVCSNTEHFLLRSAIRQTWGRSAHAIFNIGIIFLLGLSLDEEINKMTKCESQIHNDMVIEDFIDTYNNLTLKSLMMLKWVKNNCNNTSYIMKTDDDVYINMNNLMQLTDILSQFKSQNTLVGRLKCAASSRSLPKYLYQESTFPNYLSGPGYLMSIDVALKLYREAYNVPILHAEDVYITGLCSRQAGIQPAQQFMFQFLNAPNTSTVCTVDDNYLIVHSHRISHNDMHFIHHKLNACKIHKKPAHHNELYSYEC